MKKLHSPKQRMTKNYIAGLYYFVLTVFYCIILIQWISVRSTSVCYQDIHQGGFKTENDSKVLQNSDYNNHLNHFNQQNHLNRVFSNDILNINESPDYCYQKLQIIIYYFYVAYYTYMYFVYRTCISFQVEKQLYRLKTDCFLFLRTC